MTNSSTEKREDPYLALGGAMRAARNGELQKNLLAVDTTVPNSSDEVDQPTLELARDVPSDPDWVLDDRTRAIGHVGGEIGRAILDSAGPIRVAPPEPDDVTRRLPQAMAIHETLRKTVPPKP